MMRKYRHANPFFVAVTVVLAMGCAFASQAAAQGQAREQSSRTQVLEKIIATEPGSLRGEDFIELHDLQSAVDAKISDTFYNQLLRLWAVQRGLTEKAAQAELLQAYKRKHGQVPPAFERRLRDALANLPPGGSNAYVPPSYLPAGPVTVVRRPWRVGKPRFGPNFFSGMSRLSNGAIDHARRP